MTLGARAVHARSFVDPSENIAEQIKRPLAPRLRIGLALEVLALRLDQCDRVDYRVGRDFFVDRRNAHCPAIEQSMSLAITFAAVLTICKLARVQAAAISSGWLETEKGGAPLRVSAGDVSCVNGVICYDTDR